MYYSTILVIGNLVRSVQAEPQINANEAAVATCTYSHLR
jgi:hypothetical protein